MAEIKRKAALVTGAGKRIGRAIALDLAAQGWAVGVHHHHSRPEADSVVAEIEAAGGRAVALQADLGAEDQVRRLVPALTDAFGPLTVLVNNAAPFVRDEAATVTRDSWDLHMEANLRAPFVLMQAFAAQLPADEHGLVVNMLDQRVWNLTPHFMSYTVSKAGLWTLTQTMALALAPRIRVNGIGPGPTLRNERQSEAQFAAQQAATPLKRGSSPEEICAAIRFLIAAPAVTGQMIALDGGEHLGWAQSSRGFVATE
ncbi:SDR family oxidoreductase [Azospirillum sp. sgz301742]